MRTNRLISHNRVGIERILRELATSEDRFFTKKFECGNCILTIFIIEEFYLRIASDLTLTVIVEEAADKTSVEIITGGGKEGFLGLSFGAEKSAANRVVKLLKENGFTE